MLATVLLAAALAAAPGADAAPSAGAESEQRCAAVLAIIASAQQSDPENWSDFPDMAAVGPGYVAAARLRAGATDATNAAAFDAAVVETIAALQAETGPEDEREETLRAAGQSCLARGPAPPPAPSLLQCAVVAGLARDNALGRRDAVPAIRELMLFASVLEDKARTALRAAGKTDGEADIAMGLERERLERAYKRGKAEPLDFPACLDMARP